MVSSIEDNLPPKCGSLVSTNFQFHLVCFQPPFFPQALNNVYRNHIAPVISLINISLPYNHYNYSLDRSPQSIITTSSILWLLSIIFIIISFMTSIDRVYSAPLPPSIPSLLSSIAPLAISSSLSLSHDHNQYARHNNHRYHCYLLLVLSS